MLASRRNAYRQKCVAKQHKEHVIKVCVPKEHINFLLLKKIVELAPKTGGSATTQRSLSFAGDLWEGAHATNALTHSRYSTAVAYITHNPKKTIIVMIYLGMLKIFTKQICRRQSRGQRLRSQ